MNSSPPILGDVVKRCKDCLVEKGNFGEFNCFRGQNVKK